MNNRGTYGASAVEDPGESAAIRLGLAQLHAKHANAYSLLPPLDTKPRSSSRPATRPLLRLVRRVRSSTWASRVEGSDFPVASAVLPASRESAFYRPIDCSETFSLCAASATVVSPDGALNTIRVLVSGLNTGGHPMTRPPALRHQVMPSQPARQKA